MQHTITKQKDDAHFSEAMPSSSCVIDVKRQRCSSRLQQTAKTDIQDGEFFYINARRLSLDLTLQDGPAPMKPQRIPSASTTTATMLNQLATVSYYFESIFQRRTVVIGL